MTEFEKRRHRVCFTGHRPEKLTRSEVAIRKDLEIQICQAVADGLNVFVRKTLANRGFYKKKLDTRFDTHCIKTGVQLWCGCS